MRSGRDDERARGVLARRGNARARARARARAPHTAARRRRPRAARGRPRAEARRGGWKTEGASARRAGGERARVLSLVREEARVGAVGGSTMPVERAQPSNRAT